MSEIETTPEFEQWLKKKHLRALIAYDDTDNIPQMPIKIILIKEIEYEIK